MNKELLYGIGGLIIGLVIMLVIQNNNQPMRDNQQRMMGENEMHNDIMHSESSMDSSMEHMTDALKGKTGDEFDQAFLTEMIVHHEGAVAMAELALQNANRQEIKDLSQAIISAQKTEITQMNSWLSEWYK